MTLSAKKDTKEKAPKKKRSLGKLFLKVVLTSLGFLILAYVGLVIYATHASNVALKEASVPVAGQIMGNPDGTLTVVEFVDYRCHYCPIMNTTLEEALQSEPDVKVIVRPVAWVEKLSIPIAKFVLATAKQGKMPELHSRLMQLGALPDLATVKEIAKSIGVDVAQAEEVAKSKEIEDELQKNQDYVINAGLRGIPALFIGGLPYQPHPNDMKSVNRLRMAFATAVERNKKKE